MKKVYHRKKSYKHPYFFQPFLFLKTILGWVLLCSILHTGLTAQVWFKEYSFAGSSHSIYDVTKGNDQSFSILFKEENGDIFIVVDNTTGNTTFVETWGASTEDIIGGSGGVIKVGINGDSLQAVNLIKTANVTFVQWLKNYPPPFDQTFFATPVRIIQLQSGDYVILAAIKAPASFATGNLVTRIDGNGNIVWQKDISGVGRASLPFDIYGSTDDNFFIHSLAALGSNDAGHYIHKVDGQGNILWTEGPNQDPNPPGTIFFSIAILYPPQTVGWFFGKP